MVGFTSYLLHIATLQSDPNYLSDYINANRIIVVNRCTGQGKIQCKQIHYYIYLGTHFPFRSFIHSSEGGPRNQAPPVYS